MKVQIGFQNPKTGEVKHVKCGWSWTLLFWSQALGIPLFLRKLNIWGMVMLILSLFSWVIGPYGIDIRGIQTISTVCLLAFDFWLGLKGNQITAKNYLENGWVFVEPESDLTKIAVREWGINPPALGIEPENNAPLQSLLQPAPGSVKQPKSRTPLFIALAIITVCIVGFFLVHGSEDHAGIEIGSNGIPLCDSDGAKETVKSALENGEYSKLVHIQILSFESVSQLVNGNDGAANCSATILSNSGRHRIGFTISKMADGSHYYVEAQVIE